MNEFALSSVLELPVEERIRIVEAIWDSVAEEPDEISLPEWQVQELDTRFAAYQRDPSAGLTWTEVKQSILSREFATSYSSRGSR